MSHSCRCNSALFGRVLPCVRFSRGGRHPRPLKHAAAAFWPFLAVFLGRGTSAKTKQEKRPTLLARRSAHFCPQCGQFPDVSEAVPYALLNGRGTLSFEKMPLLQGFYSGS